MQLLGMFRLLLRLGCLHVLLVLLRLGCLHVLLVLLLQQKLLLYLQMLLGRLYMAVPRSCCSCSMLTLGPHQLLQVCWMLGCVVLAWPKQGREPPSALNCRSDWRLCISCSCMCSLLQ
jgi:hypothetical protein